MSNDEQAYAALKKARELARKHGFGTLGLLGVVEHKDGSATAYRVAL